MAKESRSIPLADPQMPVGEMIDVKEEPLVARRRKSLVAEVPLEQTTTARIPMQEPAFLQNENQQLQARVDRLIAEVERRGQRIIDLLATVEEKSQRIAELEDVIEPKGGF